MTGSYIKVEPDSGLRVETGGKSLRSGGLGPNIAVAFVSPNGRAMAHYQSSIEPLEDHMQKAADALGIADMDVYVTGGIPQGQSASLDAQVKREKKEVQRTLETQFNPNRIWPRWLPTGYLAELDVPAQGDVQYHPKERSLITKRSE